VPNAIVEAPAGTRGAVALAAGPTPAHDRVDLRFVLPTAAAPVFTLLDPRGRRVARLEAGPQPAGPGRRTWVLGTEGAAAPSPGVYFIRMTAGAQSAGSRIVVTP
jgi:hypothetical protein